MEINEALRSHIIEVVEQQLNKNDPPEVKATYSRLQIEGFTAEEAKKVIGQCLIVEMFEVVKSGKEYDNARYVQSLKALPEEPF